MLKSFDTLIQLSQNKSDTAAIRLAKVNKARDLIQLGAYQPGHDAELDIAVRLQQPMNALLQQDMHESAALETSRAQLCHLMNP